MHSNIPVEPHLGFSCCLPSCTGQACTVCRECCATLCPTPDPHCVQSLPHSGRWGKWRAQMTVSSSLGHGGTRLRHFWFSLRWCGHSPLCLHPLLQMPEPGSRSHSGAGIWGCNQHFSCLQLLLTWARSTCKGWPGSHWRWRRRS